MTTLGGLKIFPDHYSGKISVSYGHQKIFLELENIPEVIEEIKQARKAILDCDPERAELIERLENE